MRVGRGVRVPVGDFAPNNAVIVGSRGTGKSSLARLLVEELVAHNRRVRSDADVVSVIVFVSSGSWWGLRAGRQGRPRGAIKGLIIGGEHADFPLDAEMGGRIATLVDSCRGTPIIVQMDELSDTEQQRLVADFAEQLAASRARRLLHVVIDGAEKLASLSPSGASEMRCTAAVEVLARRRRALGIGVTVTVTRLARLSHNLSSQTERLFVLRMWAPQDLDAIGDFFRWGANSDTARRVVDQVGALGQGQAIHFTFGDQYGQRLFRMRPGTTYQSQSATALWENKPAEPKLVELPKRLLRVAQSILHRRT